MQRGGKRIDVGLLTFSIDMTALGYRKLKALAGQSVAEIYSSKIAKGIKKPGRSQPDLVAFDICLASLTWDSVIFV